MVIEPLKEDELFHNAYDIVRHSSVVHGTIAGMSDDFPLAKFDEKAKEFIIEQYSNAAYIYFLMKSLGAEQQGDNLVNFILRRPQVMAVLNRNERGNDLLLIINQLRNNVDEEVEQLREESTGKKTRRTRKRRKSKEDDDDYFQEDEFI